MTLNEVVNTIKQIDSSIVSVLCTIKVNGKIYDTNIIVADCDDNEFDDYFGDRIAPNKHWYICCGIDALYYYYHNSTSEILSLNGVEKFITDFPPKQCIISAL